jgi:hypothetical protein
MGGAGGSFLIALVGSEFSQLLFSQMLISTKNGVVFDTILDF